MGWAERLVNGNFRVTGGPIGIVPNLRWSWSNLTCQSCPDRPGKGPGADCGFLEYSSIFSARLGGGFSISQYQIPFNNLQRVAFCTSIRYGNLAVPILLRLASTMADVPPSSIFTRIILNASIGSAASWILLLSQKALLGFRQDKLSGLFDFFVFDLSVILRHSFLDFFDFRICLGSVRSLAKKPGSN